MLSEKGRHDFLNADTEFSPEALPRLEKRRWRWLGNKDLIISIRILGYQMLPMPKSSLPPRHLPKSSCSQLPLQGCEGAALHMLYPVLGHSRGSWLGDIWFLQSRCKSYMSHSEASGSKTSSWQGNVFLFLIRDTHILAVFPGRMCFI